MADPDAPAQKRPRLDSGNPVYNGHFPPPPPPHAQPTRPASHPTLVQVASPPPRQYPPHSLPPPSHSYQQPQPQGYPGPPGPQPSPSLPPTDIRALADPRNIPSPGHRPHGSAAGPAPVTVPQDSISTYRAPPTPQSSISAPEPLSSRSSISISVDVKAPPQGMEHGGHQSPWSMNPEHRSNGSVPNGYGHTISPSHSNGPVFHPPPPPPSQQYGQPVDPYAQSPYMAQYAGGQQVRRKQVRATQACNHCRSRKQKCDEARPCQFCRENNFDCQYKDVPPPKQDRSMMQLQDGVNSISEVLKEFVGEFNIWKQSVESRLAPVQGHGLEMTSNHASPEAAFTAPIRDAGTPRWPTPIQGRAQVRRVNSMKMESPIVPYSTMSPLGAQASTPIKQEAMLVASQQPATPAESVRTDHSRVTDTVPREKSGLQSDHTTPAHKLLSEWQAMNTFYKDVGYLNKLIESGHEVSDYPMQLEQDRGLLRVWGVGEGQDLNDGAQGPGSPESSNESEAMSPAPGKNGIWGHPPLDPSSPSVLNHENPREYFGQDGGLGHDGRPDFSAKTMEDLLNSYLDNIHTLHPFMNPSKLRKMVREFSDQYSPNARPTNARSPATNAMQHQLHQGMKRKRSSSAFGEPYSPRGAIERSMRNAIVLLVLAVGKVCAHKDKLPAPQSDKSSYQNGTWGSPHANGSFSSDLSEDNRPRNIDLLPGMAYYAYATDILGNQQGGNTVAHAQAMILAALYLSQFARVLESWSWINNACRVVMVLVKADYPKLIRSFYLERRAASLSSTERYRLNLVMCAYWTCLQLESDILAEMSTLPPSNISAHQSDIMYPDGVLEYDKLSSDEPEQRPNESSLSMLIYSSQIWLRVILNEAHNALYGANGRTSFDTSNVKEVAHHARTHIDILDSWRRVLPAELAWQDTDPPSTDLNIARVRAKYYGGLYMMLRPYLRIASHTIEFPPNAASAPHSSQHNSPVPGDYVSTPTNRSIHMVELSEDQRKLIGVACQCIESAIRSTIAFDRVGAPPNSAYLDYQSTRTRRLVLTNIFGTLHAQFGNMLVLVSVYKSKLLPLLPANTPLNKFNLTALLARTINVLDEVAPNSPILKMDLEILRNVRKQHNLWPA